MKKEIINPVQAGKKAQFISIVIYVHNDAERIHCFIDAVMPFFQKTFKQCEIIYVDDYSTDGSVQIIKDYYKNNPIDYVVSIIKMGHYHGLETAMNAGRDMSIGDFVYEFDSMYVDYEAEIILEAYEKCLEGNDIVTVSTAVPLLMTSKIFYKLFNKVSGLHSEIGQETFRLLSRRGINRITPMDVHIPYRKVIYLNCGLSTAKVTYKSTTGERPPRITKSSERFRLALDSFIYFSNIVERIAVFGVIGISILSVFGIIYAIYNCMTGASNGIIMLFLFAFCAVGFVGIYGLITFVIKYLSVLMGLIFKNQKYLISDVDKISSK